MTLILNRNPADSVIVLSFRFLGIRYSEKIQSGGAFVAGTGNDPVFDGRNLASRSDAVVVTINYRLGTFGFLALNDGVTNGDFGLGDHGLETVASSLVVDGTYLTKDELQLRGAKLPTHLLMGITRDDSAAAIAFPETADVSAYLANLNFDIPPLFDAIPDSRHR
ncbi:hypothetical protein GGS20DRAFT_586019 [Poronia punctata]|nr:hypothetical protein GGS20DRAFT_586019 [Poronia punctata]